MNKIIVCTTLVLCWIMGTSLTTNSLKIALLKYNGGGDWYANETALPNLVKYCNEKLGTTISEDIGEIEAGSPEIFNYAFVHMTGHGNVVFNDQEAENLRNYLLAGGFLHIDDNYGMDPYVRPAVKKIFPELSFVEVPFSHRLYHQKFDFNNGMPKVHEHDGKPAKGYGIFVEGRLVVLYTYETDLGDGWEDPEVHNDPPDVREKALKIGANIIQFVFTQ